MGCALKLLNKESEEEKTQIEKRFLIIGLDGAGKTSILNRLSQKDLTGIEPTVGLNVEQIIYKNYAVSFWDLGGAATMLWKHYYHNTDAIIFVVDSSDKDRLESVKEELINAVADRDLEKCPILIYGNKQDKEGAMNMEELSKALDFDNLQVEKKFIMPCSAMNNTGINEGLEKIVEVLLKTRPNPS